MRTEARTSTELTVRDLRVGFWVPGGYFEAVQGLSLTLNRGEVYGLVGESGSGKSCFARSLLGLPGGQPGIVSGSLRIHAYDEVKPVLDDAARYWTREHGEGFAVCRRRRATAWDDAVEQRFRPIRGRVISLLFQNAKVSLSPYHTLQKQVARSCELNGRGERDADEVAEYWLNAVNLGDHLNSYPHTLSGGQAQRAAVAVAMASDGRILVADEPTTGLDASLRREIVDLMVGMVRQHERTLILISHDLAIVTYASDRVGVMYGGRLCEEFRVDSGNWAGCHPYSKELLATIDEKLRDATIDPRGSVGAERAGTGCVYRHRCSLYESCRDAQVARLCENELPELKTVSGDQRVACWVASSKVS